MKRFKNRIAESRERRRTRADQRREQQELDAAERELDAQAAGGGGGNSSAGGSDAIAIDVSRLVVRRPKRKDVSYQDIEKALPKEIFTPDYDAVEGFLCDPELPSRFTLVRGEMGPARVEELDRIKKDRFEKLQAVTRQLSEVVLSNHELFSTELQRVSYLQDQLEMLCHMCTTSRRSLQRSEKNTRVSLGILKNHRKKMVLVGLVKTLTVISELESAKSRLEDLLKEKNFMGAIKLAYDIEDTTEKYADYDCVQDLARNLEDTFDLIEDRLNEELSAVCDSFSLESYKGLMEAYIFVEKPTVALDQLAMIFANAIMTNFKKTLVKHANTVASESKQSGGRKSTEQLCESVGAPRFEACLRDLCTGMCDLMVNYQQVKVWHEQEYSKKLERDETGLKSNHGEDEDEDGLEMPEWDQEYGVLKLKHGCFRIWQEIQKQVASFFTLVDISSYDFDRFMGVVSTINVFKNIGSSFSGGHGAATMDKAMKAKCIGYFEVFHKDRLTKLRGLLSIDKWKAENIKPDFNMFKDLKEYRFFRSSRKGSLVADSEQAPKRSDSTSDEHTSDGIIDQEAPGAAEDDDNAGIDALEMYRKGALVFKQERNEDTSQEFMDDDDTTIGPNLLAKAPLDSKESTDEARSGVSSTLPRKGPPPPHCTVTAMYVVRSIGRYLQMMKELNVIAGDVVQFITEIFEFYVHWCFEFFTQDCSDEYMSKRVSPRYMSFIKYLRNVYGRHTGNEADKKKKKTKDKEDSEESASQKKKSRWRPEPLGLCPVVDLDKEGTLFALAERITAAESLGFVGIIMRSLHGRLKKVLAGKQDKIDSVGKYYKSCVSLVAGLRKFVYDVASIKLRMFTETIPKNMSKCKWNVNDLQECHNSYIDDIVRECTTLGGRLDSFGERAIPLEAKKQVWTVVIESLCKQFVEGFATAKKCSNNGRALMQLDFGQFLNKMTKIVPLR